MCGEKLNLSVGESFLKGSPPRVRGKGVLNVRETLGQGITPACAGKSRKVENIETRKTDHPRVCGEKLTSSAVLYVKWGSPPRVRGKGRPNHCGRRLRGITPACAGKSSILLFGWNPNRDHPRVCGEKSIVIARLSFAAGSPPRVRGKARDVKTGESFNRITPACAGKRTRQAPAW